MTTDTLAPSTPRLSPATAQGLVELAVAALAVILSVSSFAVSTTFGIGATFVMVFALAMAMPAAIPLVIVASFLFQNTVVAWYAPMIPDNDAFDALRGSNFVVLMTAFVAFFTAAFQPHLRGIAPLRPWIVGGTALCAVIVVYFGLGAVTGDPKDAVVYFRNIILPVATFYVAIIAASTWRVDLSRPLVWIAVIAIAYGYLELFFTMDFLGLFHGDDYVRRNLWKQIQTGAWEKTLEQTGFVLRGLEDVMMANFFNLPGLEGVLPKVFRIGGPNFHPIAYAYALSIISVWLLFNNRWLLPLLALPLLVIIGSKGAAVLFVLALCARLALPLLGARLTIAFTVLGAVLWIAASLVIGMAGGDYHVLGFLAGVREFLRNPVGLGLGFGGNLSSTSLNINWDLAQAEGVAETPMESAVGVLLYQMGVGAGVFVVFLWGIARAAMRAYRESGDVALLFPVVGVTVIAANSVLQEEAFFSPLALGLCLLLSGVAIGTHWRKMHDPARL